MKGNEENKQVVRKKWLKPKRTIFGRVEDLTLGNFEFSMQDWARGNLTPGHS